MGYFPSLQRWREPVCVKTATCLHKKRNPRSCLKWQLQETVPMHISASPRISESSYNPWEITKHSLSVYKRSLMRYFLKSQNGSWTKTWYIQLLPTYRNSEKTVKTTPHDERWPGMLFALLSSRCEDSDTQKACAECSGWDVLQVCSGTAAGPGDCTVNEHALENNSVSRTCSYPPCDDTPVPLLRGITSSHLTTFVICLSSSPAPLQP